VGGSQAYLIGGRIGFDSIALGRVLLSGVGGDATLTLSDVDHDPAPSLPLSPVGGDLDGDALLDVAYVTATGDPAVGALNLMITLGAELSGARLRGVLPLGTSFLPQLWLADFDGDGRADLLVPGKPTTDANPISSFLILRSGVPAAGQPN
jgi:hypothetical protein